MQKFHYTTVPQEIIFGAGALEKISDVIASKNFSRVLLVSTRSQRANGNLARLENLLGEKLVAIFDSTQPHVPQANVDETTTLARENNVGAILTLGGGSAMGVAKATSYNLQSLGGARDSYSNLQISIIAIPTTYAGSEMTPLFGVTREREGVMKKETMSDTRVVPRVVIYDPLLTLDLPRGLTASTGINAFAHCVEAVYSIARNPVSTLLALEGARLIWNALPRCYENGEDVAARTEMLEGAYLAGTGLANVAMGLHHGVCHVLGGTANVPHGIANAIVLPHALRFNADACASELAQIGEAIGLTRQDERALAVDLALHVEELNARMNLPSRLRGVGVKENDLPTLARLAFENKTVQNNPKKISENGMEDFLRAMF